MEAEFTEHNPRLADGIPALRTALGATRGDAPTSPRVVPLVQYDRVHKVLYHTVLFFEEKSLLAHSPFS
jgi:hypothetical protein